ncbi:hypothetical protein B0H11DRAFT_2222409 [Mycena galericulata]|nr:hypothetical protein B0H11DRAFT_2222409 [Mycena galericulata]
MPRSSDLLFSLVLADEAFVEQFLADNRTALRARRGVDDLPAAYVVVDLAPFIARIPDPSNSDIAKLDRIDAAMLAEKVFLKPTTRMADPVPTCFRLVFTQPRPTMELALRRLERAFSVSSAPFSS